MALEATEEETREAVVEELPPEEKAEAVEVMKEIEEMSPEEKEKVALGLNNIGFFVEEKKNNLFASAFNKASSVGNEKGTVSRFAGALRDSFLKDAETARQKSIDSNNGKTRKVGNAMSLFGNVLKYARIVSDLTTKSLVSPLRYVMMAGASVARVADAGKEARLQNEEVIDKTRIADSLKAEEEAWKIYENAEAKNTGKKLSAEDLKKSYMDQMPKDLLERIGRDSSIESSFANRIVQSVIKKRHRRLYTKVE